MPSSRRWQDREYVGRPGLSPVVAGLVAGGVISPGLDLLDVGCGRGSDAVPLAVLGLRVAGVDVNARSLAHARRRARASGVAVDLRHEDVTKGLSFPRASFDVALDTLLFNNLDEDEVEAYGAEVARVLRRGGTLVLQHKVQRRSADWQPHETPRELDPWFEFGLPVHTQLPEKGGGLARAVVMVGTKRPRGRAGEGGR